MTNVEVFPQNFNVFRKNRHGSYEGVLIATKKPHVMKSNKSPCGAARTKTESVTVQEQLEKRDDSFLVTSYQQPEKIQISNLMMVI